MNQGQFSPALSQSDTSGRVSVEEASNLFAAAGVPRSPRTIRRYCQRGVLACTRIDTDNNQEQYLIERESIDRRIEELRQVYAGLEVVRSEPVVSGLDRPRQDTASRTSEFGRDLIDVLKEQMHEKDRQLGVKDQQIAALNRTLDSQIERDHETNVLIKGLQGPLWWRWIASPSARDDGPGGVGWVSSKSR